MSSPSNDIKISIALSTCNGAKFLKSQLDSILNQSYFPYELQIGDDCSTDETQYIVRDFALKAPFKVSFYKNKIRLGYGSNFIETALRCDGDWIAFCDQDDVWLPNKLERCVEEITNNKNSNITLVTHSARVVDSNLNDIGKYIPKHAEVNIAPPLGRPLDWGPLGCAQIFKKNILSRANPKQRFPTLHKGIDPFPHDLWVGLVANAIGYTVFIDDNLILYRRHDKTASPAGKSVKSSLFLESHSTGSSHYYDLHTIDNIISNILLEYKSSSSSLLDMGFFADSSDAYRRRSNIMLYRSMMYDESFFFKRLCFLYNIIRINGYKYSNISPLSFKSFVKDVTKVFLGRFF